MSRTGKPMWRVIAEKNSTEKNKSVRFYNVIAPELEKTARGTRSNEYNVREVCNEKGYNVIGAMFAGYTNSIPSGAIDISVIEKEEETKETPKKFVKKTYTKKR